MRQFRKRLTCERTVRLSSQSKRVGRPRDLLPHQSRTEPRMVGFCTDLGEMIAIEGLHDLAQAFVRVVLVARQ
jgi:hypothetical protein